METLTVLPNRGTAPKITKIICEHQTTDNVHLLRYLYFIKDRFFLSCVFQYTPFFGVKAKKFFNTKSRRFVWGFA